VTTSTEPAATAQAEPPQPPLSQRETELLSATLAVLRETGYDNLTIDQVVARARSSKATVYRRWPSKVELVCAALAFSVRNSGVPPDSGSLRGDLLRLAEVIAEDNKRRGAVVAGILAAGQRSPRLQELLLDQIYELRREQVHGVLGRAVDRGEIVAGVISEDIWDVLPGYITFRSLIRGRPITSEMLRALIDEVLLPSLTRRLPP
jgi:AcrR family transcriptional regulator